MDQTTQLMTLEHGFVTWILYFFAYGFVGWLWESGYVSVRKHKWINSGFLNGPVIPVYGFSMTAVLAAVAPFSHNIVYLYLISAVVVTVIEYITSWLMEKLFHARWWDYSNVPLNLQGRVALPISAFWGIGVVFIVKVVHPFVAQWVTHVNTTFGIFAVVLLVALFMFDFGFTLANLLAFGAATKRIGDTIETTKKELHERAAATGERLEEAHPWLETYRKDREARAKLPKLSAVQRRLLTSFPNMKLNDTHTSAKDIADLANLVKQLSKKEKK